VQSDTIIVVGAASRGIIQRGHESTAAMYKTYYAPNPFDNITEEDVEEYKEEIQRKTRGGISGTHLSARFYLRFKILFLKVRYRSWWLYHILKLCCKLSQRLHLPSGILCRFIIISYY